MSAAYLIGSLVGALAVFDGTCMVAKATPLFPIPRWSYPSTRVALRWMGVGETVLGIGIAAGFGVLATSGPVPAAAYIVATGVAGQCFAYATAWWVDYRARRPASD
jgi:hypothetical protein